MTKWGVVAIALVLGCKGKGKPPPDPTPGPPVASVDAAIAVDAAAAAGTPTPTSKRGFVVFTSTLSPVGKVTQNEPLWLVDPDAGAPIKTPVDQANQLVIGPHVIAGRHGSGGDFWLMDLRAPTLVAKKHEPVNFITPEDRLVWSCSDGFKQPNKFCIADADDANKKEVFSEPYGDENANIRAAGRELVHADYSVIGKKPPFSIAIADGKRTDFPKLMRRAKSDEEVTFEPFYSPSGAKAVSCAEDLVVTTFDGSVKPQVFKLPRGKPVRCTCQFSHDDTLMACSILPPPPNNSIDQLELWDLKTGKQTQVAKEISISEFAFSHDGTQLAYITLVDEKKWVLKVSSLDGKTTRDLFSLEDEDRLLDLVGWVAPN